MKRSLTLVATVVSFICGGAFAATPTAAWKGDFPKTVSETYALKNGVYLVPNAASGNTVADDRSKITIGSTKGFYLANDTSGGNFSATPVTVIAALKNPVAGYPLIVCGYNTAYNRFGMLLSSTSYLHGIYTGTSWSSGTTTVSGAASDAARFFGYSYAKEAGSQLACGGSSATLSGLKEAANNIMSVTIGSYREGTPATGMECSAVFFFKEQLDAAALQAWTADPVSEFAADKHVELSADASLDSELSVLSVEVKSALTLTVADGASLTVQGGFFANQPVTIDVDCANRVSGSMIVTGPIYSSSNISVNLTNAPEGAQVEISDNGICYNPVSCKIISINFGNQGAATASDGIFPIAAGAWENRTAEANTVTGIKVGTYIYGSTSDQVETVSGMTLSWSSKNVYNYSSSTDTVIKGYLDDGSGVKVNLTGIPFATYDVYVYAATDTSGVTFEPVYVASYNADEVAVTNRFTCGGDGEGYIPAASANGRWGRSQNATSQMGTNVIRIPNQHGSILNIVTYQSTNNNQSRAGVAAVQIVERKDTVRFANVAADADWTNLAWDPELGDDTAWTNVVLRNNSGAAKTVTLDRTVTLDTLYLQGTNDFVLAMESPESFIGRIDGTQFSGGVRVRYTGDLADQDLDFGNVSIAVTNLALNVVELSGNPTLKLDTAGSPFTNIVVSGAACSKAGDNEVKLAHKSGDVFEIVQGGSFTAQGRVMLGQELASELRIAGGAFTADENGFFYPNGAYGTGTYTVNIVDGGSFTAPFNPYNGDSALGCTVRVNVSGETSNFAPANLWTSSNGSKATADDTATSRSGSNESVTLSDGGTFTIPATGVPNWLPVTVTDSGTLVATDSASVYSTVTVNAGSSVVVNVPAEKVLTLKSVAGTGSIVKAGEGELVIEGNIANHIIYEGQGYGTVRIADNAVWTRAADAISRSIPAGLTYGDSVTILLASTYADDGAISLTGLTSLPEGVTIKVLTPIGAVQIDEVSVTATETGLAIAYDLPLSGAAAWFDYTFSLDTLDSRTNEAANASSIVNAGSAGADQALKYDTNYNKSNSYNPANGMLLAKSTPWRDMSGATAFPVEFTAAVFANVPDVENCALMAFGSSTAGNAKWIAIVRGADNQHIRLVNGTGTAAYDSTTVVDMAAENATSTKHLVVFSCDGTTMKVYCDGDQVGTFPAFTLGNGFQIGSIHGGVTNTGVIRLNDSSSVSEEQRDSVEVQAIRLYNGVLGPNALALLSEEFPYVSPNGQSKRIFPEAESAVDANWSAAEWETTLDSVTAADQAPIANSAIVLVNENTHGVNLSIDTTAAYGKASMSGSGAIVFAAADDNCVSFVGAVGIDAPVTVRRSVAASPVDISTVPVTIGENGSITFEIAGVKDLTAPVRIKLTGISDAAYLTQEPAKIAVSLPADETLPGHYLLNVEFNATDSCYYALVGPEHALGSRVYLNTADYLDTVQNPYLAGVLADGSGTATVVLDNDIVVIADGYSHSAWMGANARYAALAIETDFSISIGEVDGPAFLAGKRLSIADGRTFTMVNSYSNRRIVLNGLEMDAGNGMFALDSSGSDPSIGAITGTGTIKLNRNTTITGGIAPGLTSESALTLTIPDTVTEAIALAEIDCTDMTIDNASTSAVTVGKIKLAAKPAGDTKVLGVSGTGEVALTSVVYVADEAGTEKSLSFVRRADGYYLPRPWVMIIAK
ncbi:MAG: hypothetical protein ACI4R9_06125 [Kiritimatiellia bacterium]